MMNLNHLKYFYDVCKTKSITESAKMNFVSHSAISQAIKNLESVYEVDLMIHKKNYFELSSEGLVLFESIQPIFDSIKLSQMKLEALKKELSGDLKLGFSYSMAMSFMPEILKKFKNSYPQINQTIKLSNSKNLAELITNRNIEIGIGIEDDAFFQLESRFISKGRFVLVSSKKEYSLKNEPFLIGDKGEEIKKFKQFYQKNKLTNQVIEINSWEVVSRFVQAGMGIGLIPDFILNSNFSKNLHPVDVGLKLPSYEMNCYFRDSKLLSRNAIAFLDHFTP